MTRNRNDKPESFLRFALRGTAIGVALVALLILGFFAFMFFVMPEGWAT